MTLKKLLLIFPFTFMSVSCLATNTGDWVKQAALQVEPSVIEWRHDFHQNPELGGFEVETSKKIVELLKKFGITDIKTGIARTGVVATLKGGQPGPTIALRADMDALPLKETTNIDWASKKTMNYKGQQIPIMHACGHDVHTAMLLGAAKVLSENRDKIRGTVVFIFQPAEEGQYDIDPFEKPQKTWGARKMVEENVLKDNKVQAVFAIHVLAKVPTGRIAYKAGPTYNSSDGLRITVNGQSTHGSMPWTGIDPVVAAANVINSLQTVVSRQVPLNSGFGTVSIGAIHGGSAGNIIPNSVEMVGTIRSDSPLVRAEILKKIPSTVQHAAEAIGASANVEIAEIMPVTVNNEALTEAMVPYLTKAADGKIFKLERSVPASEDFSFFSNEVPGLYVLLGVTPENEDMEKAVNNHNSGFVADDKALVTGVRAHVEFVIGVEEQFDQLKFKN